MAEPISVISLALQICRLIAPIAQAVDKAYHGGKTVHESLYELRSDLVGIQILSTNVHQLFWIDSFVDTVEAIQRDSNLNLVADLERALSSCLREAQKLHRVLENLGLHIREHLVKQVYLQWRLDRRLDQIDQIKRNFLDHKISIQLAFQLLTTCKQMQIAERDASKAAELQAQIGELRDAIQQLSNQIFIRQAESCKDEKTKLLDEMKTMETTSVKLQQRASERLESITARATSGTEPTSQSSPAVALLQVPAIERDEPISSTSIDSKNGVVRETMQPAASSSISSPSPLKLTISAQRFEEENSRLLASATDQSMGTIIPFSDDTIASVSSLLAAVGKNTWAERPRTYLVLRLINEIKLMDTLILDGFKDIDFSIYRFISS